LKRLLKNIYKAYQHFLFRSAVSKSNRRKLLLDIDNTLADTWPSLSQTWESEQSRHLALAPILPVIQYLQSRYSVDEYDWIFLTSRKYNMRKATIEWLRSQQLPARNGNVILVQSPAEKVELIKKYLKQPAAYYDDLSYNHEKGEVRFYHNEIAEIKRIAIVEFFGYGEINEIVKKHEQTNK
jgi:hypothetical protein